jgi:transcriptional regulator with GAF, ATPase, and Fis domain
MSRLDITADQSWTYRRPRGGEPGEAVPGLLLLHSGSEAKLLPIPLDAGPQVLGRDGVGGVYVEDGCMSRQHAEVSFDGNDWRVRDLGSRNGTYLDAERVSRVRVTRSSRVLRVGDTLFGLLSDVRAYQSAVVERIDEVVIGPTLRRPWDEIERAAKIARPLHITGESGSGKELAARHFHQSGGRAREPFVAVNCATIPPNLAERLLFGAKKGAYSGADADADGYLHAAHGGTLFLDEIGELDLAVQAKLLRAIEAKEVLPLGASRPRAVDFALCSATHRDLRAQVGAGKFRGDLLFRIATSTVNLPALRDRIEDIPWIIQFELQKLGKLMAHVSLVEACLVRAWPGNVRELLSEVGHAATTAEAQKASRVELSHLRPTAGLSFEPPIGEQPTRDDAAILDALRLERGNVTRAARALGMHRNQLRRWVARNEDQVKDLVTSDEDQDQDG